MTLPPTFKKIFSKSNLKKAVVGALALAGIIFVIPLIYSIQTLVIVVLLSVGLGIYLFRGSNESK